MKTELILAAIKCAKVMVKYGKPAAKGLIVGGVVALTFKWLWDMEQKIIRLERDAYFDIQDPDNKRC